MNNEPIEPNNLPDVEIIENVVREAAQQGNPFAVAMYRNSRGLPKAKKEAVLVMLTVNLLQMADLIAAKAPKESGEDE